MCLNVFMLDCFAGCHVFKRLYAGLRCRPTSRRKATTHHAWMLPATSALSAKSWCDASIGDNVERLAKLRTMQSAWLSVPPVEEFTTQLQDRIASKDADPDYWGFQTCAEFGFYQTCEVGSQCMYLQGFVTLASMMDFCTSQYVSSAIYIVVTCYPCVWSSKHHAVYREGVVLVCYPCVWEQ